MRVGTRAETAEHPDGRGTRLSTKLSLAPRAENRIAKGKVVNLVHFQKLVVYNKAQAKGQMGMQPKKVL